MVVTCMSSPLLRPLKFPSTRSPPLSTGERSWIGIFNIPIHPVFFLFNSFFLADSSSLVQAKTYYYYESEDAEVSEVLG